MFEALERDEQAEVVAYLGQGIITKGLNIGGYPKGRGRFRDEERLGINIGSFPEKPEPHAGVNIGAPPMENRVSGAVCPTCKRKM